MIRINTTHIEDQPLVLNGEEKGDFLELDPKEFPRPCGPVSYHLTASMAGHDLLVTGSVCVPLAVECARCLKKFKVRQTVPDVCLLYEGVAGQIVDISNEIREDLLLSLPAVFHCKKSCRGLCPHCGADLNKGPCHCAEEPPPPPEDSPWSALDNLKF